MLDLNGGYRIVYLYVFTNLDYHFFFVFQTLPRHSILHPSLLKVVINQFFLESIQLLSKLSKIVASFSLIDFKQHFK